MDSRTQRWASGLQALDLGHFALAAELDAEERTNAWKDYTFSQEYPVESKQGKHPSTFGSFLEGHSFDLREQGFDISRGELAETLEIYRWCTQLGANIQQMAYLGLALLKQVYRQYKDQPPEAGARILAEAFASKQQYGKYHLPSFHPEGKVSFSIETQDLGDGTYQLLALIVTKDGKQYKNRWPKPLLHYLTKRLRASNVTRDATSRNALS